MDWAVFRISFITRVKARVEMTVLSTPKKHEWVTQTIRYPLESNLHTNET
jgi:hypothetical protein